MVTIGFLGPQGTYTEEAAKAAVAEATYLPYPSIEAVFEATMVQVTRRPGYQLSERCGSLDACFVARLEIQTRQTAQLSIGSSRRPGTGLAIGRAATKRLGEIGIRLDLPGEVRQCPLRVQPAL